MDYEGAGLLEGLEGAERHARLDLLERLTRAGATEPELIEAAREQRLPLLLVERRLSGPHSAREVAEASDVPVELILRLRRLAGLPEPEPDEPAFTEEDIAQARALRQFRDAGFEIEALADLTRVLGESMARLAAAVTGVFAETFIRAGDSEHEVAERFDAVAADLTPALTPVMAATLKAHLRESVRRGRLLREELETGQLAGQAELNVCFADLVGFTRLGGRIEGRELSTMAGRLAGLAGEVAEGPVRLIKTIGDAVMLVSETPGPLVGAALALIEGAEAAELPSLRAGIACGPAVPRGGDWFGHSVNLASRVTGVARPASVLATQEVRDSAGEEFRWSFAGRFKLKGISAAEPLHRARRLEAAGDPSERPRGRR